MSTHTGATDQFMGDFGNTTAPGTTTHHLTQYRAASGALVFSAGSVQWAWGLDAKHDGNGAAADVRMQQAQVNLLADMGAQPLTLQSNLVATTKSTDTTAPTTQISAPAAGVSVTNGTAVTVTGTAADIGGVVAGVEVSTDAGATWRVATGTTTWSFTYLQQGTGTVTVLARSIDDSANYASTPAALPLTVAGPYSVFGAETPPIADSGDASAVELGLRFTPTVDGYVSAVRFYKSSANTGTHTGTLWNAAGNRLAVVTFSGESASGWQSAVFSTPVPVTAGQTYTVSYYAPKGHYSVTPYYWAYRSTATTPLAVAGGFGATPAGVYNSNGAFPASIFRGNNYFVDAVFTPGALPVAPSDPAGSTTLFGSETPTISEANDSAAVEVAVAFSSSVAGTVSAIKFYKGLGNTGTHVGRLWSADGTVLSTVTFINETAIGWQSATLGTPVNLTAGASYTVSYLAPQGRYSLTSAYFSTSKVSGTLTAPATSNGRYRYGSSGAVPTLTYNATNYFVDVVFTPGSTSTPTPTPTPTAGSSTIFGTETPTVAAAVDTASVELGVSFTPTVAGTVTAIRFYKGTSNTGVHVGRLWSATGANLATVTFANESASGWQSAQLSTPVTLAAGTSYVVSYFAPQGRYSVTSGYFSTAKSSGPLTVPITGNGRYLYASSGGFPSQSYKSSNYFVDITFVPAA